MNETKKGTLKGYFAPAARPTSTQFGEFVDAAVHLNDINNNNLELNGSITVGDRITADLRALRAGTIKYDPVLNKFQGFNGTVFVDLGGGGAVGNPLTIGSAVLSTPSAGALNGFAVLAHSGFNTDTDFGFAQSSSGNTIINVGAGLAINFNNAGIPQMVLKNGKLTIGRPPIPPPIPPPPVLLEVFGDAQKAGGGIWGTLSDERIKKNIETFNEGIDTVRKLRIVTFQFNGKAHTTDGAESIGVIAQEAMKVLPEAVSTSRVKLNEEDTEETEILSFNGSTLFYKMINAIKDVDRRLAELEAKTKTKK